MVQVHLGALIKGETVTVLGSILALLLLFWYFEAGSVRQMVEDITGKPVRPIIKKVKNRDKN